MNKRICTAAAVLALTMCTVHAEAVYNLDEVIVEADMDKAGCIWRYCYRAVLRKDGRRCGGYYKERDRREAFSEYYRCSQTCTGGLHQ